MRKKWTTEEEQKLVDWTGIYSNEIIAKKLKRTINSVQKKLQNLGISHKDFKSKKGVVATDFAERMGVPVANVYYWVKKCNLPTIQLAKFMSIKNVPASYILIDDEKLEDWLRIGWALNPALQPTDKYYSIILRDVRQEINISWISKSSLIDICNLTDKVVQSWQRRLSFPRAVFYSNVFGVYMFEKSPIIDWINLNPKYIKKSLIYNIKMCNIENVV